MRAASTDHLEKQAQLLCPGDGVPPHLGTHRAASARPPRRFFSLSTAILAVTPEACAPPSVLHAPRDEMQGSWRLMPGRGLGLQSSRIHASGTLLNRAAEEGQPGWTVVALSGSTVDSSAHVDKSWHKPLGFTLTSEIFHAVPARGFIPVVSDGHGAIRDFSHIPPHAALVSFSWFEK